MAELSVFNSKWIRVDPWECSQGHWMRTLLVLRHFKELLEVKYCRKDLPRLMLLCGGDFVDSFPQLTSNGARLWEPNDLIEIVRDFGRYFSFYF